MTEDATQGPTGEGKGPVEQGEQATQRIAGELSLEELAKIAAGQAGGGLSAPTSTLLAASARNQSFTSPSRTP